MVAEIVIITIEYTEAHQHGEALVSEDLLQYEQIPMYSK